MGEGGGREMRLPSSRLMAPRISSSRGIGRGALDASAGLPFFGMRFCMG